MLALASGIPFNGMFLYVLSAPVFLGEILRLAPAQFFWFFVLTIAGIMAGAFLSGRMAGRVKPTRQIRYGFLVMAPVGDAQPRAQPAVRRRARGGRSLPIALYAFGWAMMVPVVTLMVLDLVPERRGMASSLQAFVGSTANGLVAGVVAPLVMHSARRARRDVARDDGHRRRRLARGQAAPAAGRRRRARRRPERRRCAVEPRAFRATMADARSSSPA